MNKLKILENVRKECKRLGVFGDYWSPFTMPIQSEDIRIFMALSERRFGKTTNCLLPMIVDYWLNGVRGHYIRNESSEVTRAVISHLFGVINKEGYIDRITNGIYNSVDYIPMAHAMHLCKRDENGAILERDENMFCYVMSCDKSETYKSGYNPPSVGIIIFDEFCITTRQNRFIEWNNILSTLLTYNDKATVLMLANTIDPTNYFFSEYCIADHVRNLQAGEHIVCQYSDKNETKIYVEFLKSKEVSDRKSNVIKRFFDIPNPKLNAITGIGWDLKQFPHIPKGAYTLKYSVEFYIECQMYGKFRIVIGLFNDKDIVALVTPSTKDLDNERYHVYSDIIDKVLTYKHHFIYNTYMKEMNLLLELFNEGKCLFATNGTGHLFSKMIHDKAYNKPFDI